MILTWNIEQLSCKPFFNDKENVVETIKWKLNAIDGDFVSNIYGSVGINYEDETSFTNYNELSNDMVIQWVKDSLGEEQVTNYENQATLALELLKNPVVVNLPLPWENLTNNS